jgi:hypothetical protein
VERERAWRGCGEGVERAWRGRGEGVERAWRGRGEVEVLLIYFDLFGLGDS